ncbi:MAG: hypothetical protein EAZ27_10170, partial [Cytophagales bacterium]
HQFYGFGANAGILRYQVDSPPSAHVFYTGTSATTSTELMRIQGNGNVGIGTSTPSNRLDVFSDFPSNNTIENVFRVSRGTSGTASAGIGSGMVYAVENSLGNQIIAGRTSTTLNTVTAGTENGSFNIDVINGGALTIVASFGSGGQAIFTGNPASNNPSVSFGRVTATSGVESASMTFRGNGISNMGFSFVPNATAANNRLTLAQGLDANPGNMGNNLVSFMGDGRVGLGITNPSQRLQVQNGNILLSNTGTAGELRFAEPSAGGINYSAIRAGLQTADITYTLPLSTPAAGQVLSSDATGNLSWIAGSNLSGSGTNGAVNFWTGTNTQSADAANFFWDNTNKRLGIGTNAPANKLEVNGNITTSPATANQYVKSGGFMSNQIGQVSDFGANDVGMYGIVGGHLRIVSGGANSIFVQNGGNIGIGTSTPNSKLDIAGGALLISNGFANNTARPTVGTSRIAGEVSAYGTLLAGDDGFMRLSAGGGTTAAEKTYIDISGFSQLSDMNKNIVFGVNGVERMRIINGGNVGIGTNNPLSLLHVFNGGINIESTTNDAFGRSTTFIKSRNNTIVTNGDELGLIQFLGHDGTAGRRAAYMIAHADGTPSGGVTPGRISFFTSQIGGADQLRMIIKNDGNVGIATNTPSERLDVVGNAKVTGEYKYAAPKVRFKSYSHVEFDREGTNTVRDFDFGSFGALVGGTGGQNQTMYTLLDLPDGATVTGLYFNYVDDDATYNFTDASIWRTNATAGMALGYSEHFLISPITDFAAPTIAEVSSLSSTLVIDNNNYAYILRYLTSEFSANLKFVRMKVRYQVSDAD